MQSDILALYGKATASVLFNALDVGRLYVADRGRWDNAGIWGCCWYDGYITGIRQERQRWQQRKARESASEASGKRSTISGDTPYAPQAETGAERHSRPFHRVAPGGMNVEH